MRGLELHQPYFHTVAVCAVLFPVAVSKAIEAASTETVASCLLPLYSLDTGMIALGYIEAR